MLYFNICVVLPVSTFVLTIDLALCNKRGNCYYLKRRKFGKLLDIIPLSDNVRKLKAICKRCKKRDEIFTHRKNAKTNNQVVIE